MDATDPTQEDIQSPHPISQAIQQKVQEAVVSSNISSIDELNAVAQEAAHQQNLAPVDDFCGLSPSQMHALLHFPFDSDLFTYSISITSVETSIMRLFLALTEAIGETGLKATAKGNLPLNFCKELAEQFIDESAGTVPPRIGGIRTELDFDELHCTRLVAELAGLIRKYRGKFVLTKKCQQLLAAEKMGEVYFELFRSYATKFNWGYRDSFEEAQFIQQSFLFTLYLLHKYGNTEQSEDFYSDKFITAFPMVPDMFPQTSYSTSEDDASRCYLNRVIDRFAHFFGFVALRNCSEKPYTRDYLVKKTPLLDSFICFNT